MTSVSQLNKLCKLYGGNTNTMTTSSSESEISEPSQVQSRNELSKLLSMANRSVSVNTNNSQNSNSGSSAEQSQVDDYQEKLLKAQSVTNKHANKVVSKIKYLASPLRLYIKANTAFMNYQERITYVNSIDINDNVKTDFISNWTMDDHYGLMVLIKMIRFRQNIFPSITNHDEYMACFRPLDPVARNCPSFARLFAISQYLFNIALQTPYPTKVKQFYQESRNELLKYAEDEGIEDVYDYLVSDLNSKIAFEINLAVNMIDIPVKVKLIDGNAITKNRQELLQEIYNIFVSKTAIPDAQLLAANMQEWLQSDPPSQQAGKKTRRIKKVIKKNKK